ncbi:Anaerobic nitric oxide reductase transcription regulator NorR [Planctomycetes bacterium LzC2]|uniref:Anaerobic nitric oxide reductase transcription regulator NorR n=2 Tax=Alienimonas chondri TaxID=2681879 RepID=A0ABX1VG40_9PLAN|nr:Anaerobic nitric oxide reductase transcription regulator NorR [Alienimonas chondri]
MQRKPMQPEGERDPMGGRILIADDEPLFRTTTAKLLEQAGYECVCVADAHAAIEKLRAEQFDLVLSDLNMPGNLKLELLRDQQKHRRGVPIVVVTGVPSLPTAIDSIRLGITDYLLKPVKLEDLLASVRRALKGARGERDAPLPPGEGADLSALFPNLVGASPKMRELFEVIERVAPTKTNVLITGESGTGKEVVAQAIHRRSQRPDGPFQIIDCTAVPESLFESMLFGHAKGSFTGAVKDSEGLLKQADGGTAFFDELGELPLPLQAKLLRAVQQQTFTPVGSQKSVSVDTRFVCATNRDLAAEVGAGRFRQDLYYRLGVIHIELPPLRERGDDVRLLAERFLKRLKPEDSPVRGFSEAAVEALRRHRWPGNVRELRNVVERAFVLARGELIEPADFPEEVRRSLAGERSDGPATAGAVRSLEPNETGIESSDGAPSESGSLLEEEGAGVRLTFPTDLPRDEALRIAEEQYLVHLLREHDGNVSAAAQHAGLSRQGLHKIIKQHDIDVSKFRR